MDPQPQDNLGVLLSYAREEYENQRAHHAELVRRGAAFLSFVTALIGLAALSAAKGTPERWLLTAGVVALIVAAVLLVMVTWLRKYTDVPDSMALYTKYGGSTADEVRKAVMLTTLDVIQENERPLRTLEHLYQWGATLVAVGAAAIGTGVIWGAWS
jgi:hypothetical protein